MHAAHTAIHTNEWKKQNNKTPSFHPKKVKKSNIVKVKYVKTQQSIRQQYKIHSKFMNESK